MTLRAVQEWVQDLDASPKGPLGRPRLSDATRAWAYQVVAQEWHLQGIGAGEKSVFEALRGRVSRTLVRESLKRLKAELRQRTRERLERNRQQIQPVYRDTMWSLDAQELARGVAGMPGAGIVQAEMIRDVASTKTIEASAGPPADGDEVVILLERAAAERGTWPLVLVSDNGSPYRSEPVKQRLRDHQVIHLLNEPHTPEHNPWVEHGHGEHQQQMMLGAWDVVPDLDTLRAELARATRTLDHGRLRATRGWKTAADCDLGLMPASGVISRAVLYETVCQATARAVEGLDKARERRRAEREAILATLQSFGLINRTRGGVPIPTPKSELIT